MGKEYRISCEITGDNAPTSNPWHYSSDKTEVKNDTKARVTVLVVLLDDPTGINSTIVFANVTEKQLRNYTCEAGEGKEAGITLAASGGK